MARLPPHAQPLNAQPLSCPKNPRQAAAGLLIAQSTHGQVALHARLDVDGALVVQAQHLPHHLPHELHTLCPAGRSGRQGASNAHVAAKQPSRHSAMRPALRCGVSFQSIHALLAAHLSWSAPSRAMRSAGVSTAPSATSHICTACG